MEYRAFPGSLQLGPWASRLLATAAGSGLKPSTGPLSISGGTDKSVSCLIPMTTGLLMHSLGLGWAGAQFQNL